MLYQDCATEVNCCRQRDYVGHADLSLSALEGHYSVEMLRSWNVLFRCSFGARHCRDNTPKMKRVTALDDKLVQRICVFFCVKLGWSYSATKSRLQEVFGDRTLHRNRISFWHSSFTNGRTLLVDQERAHKRRSARTDQNIAAVRDCIAADKKMSVEGIHRQTGVSRSTVHRILRKDLHLVRKAAKFVPAVLTPRHLRDRYEASCSILETLRHNPDFLKTVVTMDESWVYLYDPELKCQSAEWLPKNAPRPSKPRRGRATGKCLLVSFFDWHGLIHHEYLRNQTIDSDTFIRIVGRMQQALRRKRGRVRYLLHMDNASPHTARITRLFLLLTGQRTLTHPARSPDLAPNDFWFYGRLKKGLRGRVFPDLDALEAAVDHEIGQIPSHEYEECVLRAWPRRWARCLYRDGDYFEGLS